MAVYVDDPVWEWRGRRWCHLLADSEDELHAFAAALGVRRTAFQHRPGAPWKDHYDLPEDVRRAAVAAGAREIDLRAVAGRLRARRHAAGQR